MTNLSKNFYAVGLCIQQETYTYIASKALQFNYMALFYHYSKEANHVADRLEALVD